MSCVDDMATKGYSELPMVRVHGVDSTGCPFNLLSDLAQLIRCVTFS